MATLTLDLYFFNVHWKKNNSLCFKMCIFHTRVKMLSRLTGKWHFSKYSEFQAVFYNYLIKDLFQFMLED